MSASAYFPSRYWPRRVGARRGRGFGGKRETRGHAGLRQLSSRALLLPCRARRRLRCRVRDLHLSGPPTQVIARPELDTWRGRSGTCTDTMPRSTSTSNAPEGSYVTLNRVPITVTTFFPAVMVQMRFCAGTTVEIGPALTGDQAHGAVVARESTASPRARARCRCRLRGGSDPRAPPRPRAVRLCASSREGVTRTSAQTQRAPQPGPGRSGAPRAAAGSLEAVTRRARAARVAKPPAARRLLLRAFASESSSVIAVRLRRSVAESGRERRIAPRENASAARDLEPSPQGALGTPAQARDLRLARVTEELEA